MRLIFRVQFKKVAIDEIRGYTCENSGRNLMTPELIAIIAVGVAVVGQALHQNNALRREMNERFKALEDRMTQIEKQQAKLEGLLEGLREALTYNRAA